MFIQIFCPFKKLDCLFLLLSCKYSLYIMDRGLYQNVLEIFSPSVSLDFLNGVFEEQSFLILKEVQFINIFIALA